ncbi:hypothetical protein ACXYMX_03230 [Sporosarcina sp. CAU 1771]
MIPIDKLQKKKVAIYICDLNEKGTYPTRRVETIAKELTGVEVVFIRGNQSVSTPEGYETFTVSSKSTLLNTLRTIEPDLLLRDSGSTSLEEVEKIRSLVPSIIHFDDFGEGGKHADLVFQTLYEDTNDKAPEHYVEGIETFIADEKILPYKNTGLQKNKLNPIPHLIISFDDKDPGNLTYRALRHMFQLQIPLKVTALIGEQYSHDVSELRMMALGRRNTFIQVHPYDFSEIYSTADVVLCGSGYMPYDVAYMGIPAVVLAQNDFEQSLAFPKEQHGFIHLGSGRKVKQSSLLNAIMELLLHEPLRKRAIQRQTALELGDGLSAINEAILYYLEYPKRKLDGTAGKETSDMLQ